MSSIGKYLFSRQFLVFLFFLLAASIGWLMNKLSADYSRAVTFDIEFYNSKDNRLVFKTENSVTAQINMNGFLAVRDNLKKRTSISIDISNKYPLQTNKQGKYFVLASDIFARFSEELGAEKKLASITPDSIFFTHNEKQSKRVPVISNLQLSFAAEYMQKGKVELTPDSIWISAPEATLDSINAVYCIARKYRNISEPIKGTLDIDKNTTSRLSLQQNKVNFKINVERYSEGTAKIPVQLLNQPNNVDVLIFPAEIEIKYRAGVSDFKNISAQNFRLTANFKDFAKSMNRNLKVNIESMPKNVLSVELQNNFVEIIVNKK